MDCGTRFFEPSWDRKTLALQEFDPEHELQSTFPSKSAFIHQLLSADGQKRFKDILLQVVLYGVALPPDYLFPVDRETPHDALYMQHYKTQQCADSECRQKDCFAYHCEDERRRVLVVKENGVWNYKAELCRRKATCPGDECTLAHSSLEVNFHPMKYRTQPCRQRRNLLGLCVTGVHCYFAHDASEFRTPAPNVFPLPETPAKLSESSKSSEETAAFNNFWALNELSRARLTPTTHCLIEGLLAAQQECTTLRQTLQELRVRLSTAENRVACACCRARDRRKLFTCGHSVCEKCAHENAKHCPHCNKLVLTLPLKCPL